MKPKYFLSLFLLLFIGASYPWGAFAGTINVSAVVPGCGDGIIGSGEQCDGANLDGATCGSRGFAGGTLSCSSICTFETSACSLSAPVQQSGSGGGGGGGGFTPMITSVIFSGRAYPLSKVTILKDGQIALTTIAGPDSNFSSTISGLSTGNYSFAVYGEDKNNIRSTPFTFPVYITSGATTNIGGIFIAPTISTDKSEVHRGDSIAIFGQSAPSSEVTVNINSDNEFFVKQKADTDGTYLINFDTANLENGQHLAKSKASLDNDISSFGNAVGFIVGSKNVSIKNRDKDKRKEDLDNDGRVDLIDFSIEAYWYKRANPPAFADLNGDGKVDLIDLSIMAYSWTG